MTTALGRLTRLSAPFAAAASTLACGSPTTTLPKPSKEAASCNFKTDYAGDDACIPAPPPGIGMQFHYGPSDYSNPDEVQAFVLEPTVESLDCMYLKASNGEKIYFSEFKNSLRPGSHHMVVNELPSDVADGLRPCSLDFGTPGDGGIMKGPRLVGGTSVARGRAGGGAAPEDEGLADYVEAHSQIEMQLHFINTGSEPLLREAWMNVIFMDPDKVKQVMEPVQGLGDVGWAIPPGVD